MTRHRCICVWHQQRLFSSIRERLLDTIGMTKELRAEAQQILFLHDLVDTCGHLTEKGTFVSNLDCETEHGCLLWIAKEYNVLPDAITIFYPSWQEIQPLCPMNLRKCCHTQMGICIQCCTHGMQLHGFND